MGAAERAQGALVGSGLGVGRGLRYASPMSDSFSPTLLLLGALLLGAGLYLIQRTRFLLPALLARSPALRGRPRLARGLFFALLTLGILAGGMGCRIVWAWLRG